MVTLFLLAFAIVCTIVFSVIAAFFHNVILFDSLAFAIVGGIYTNQQFGIHPAYCLLIGIGIFILLISLHTFKITFWIIGIAFSIFWAWAFGMLAYEASGYDPIWGWVIGGLSFAMMIGLHLKSREDMPTIDESIA